MRSSLFYVPIIGEDWAEDLICLTISMIKQYMNII